MLVRLKAEEQLEGVHEHSLGSGLLDKKDFRAAIARLERAARVRRRPAAQATPAMLAAAGIGMVTLPASPPSESGEEVKDGG